MSHEADDVRARDPQQAPAPRARQAHTWGRYLHFWGRRVERDVDDELAFHLEMRTRENVARGMSEAEARADAVRRLGDLHAARAACIETDHRMERRMTRTRWLDALAQDVRFAFRSSLRQKGWTAIAVLTLALGIGANTAVFSVVNSLLLHPLPYPRLDRVRIVFQEPSEGNATGMSVMISPTVGFIREWRASSRSFEAIEPFGTTDMGLRQGDGVPAVVHTARVLPSFMRFAGVRPLLGRGFLASDLGEEAGRVAVIGEPMWRARFGSDPSIVGKPITLDGKPYTVIGVAPPDLRLPQLDQPSTDVWLPLDLATQTNLGLALIGRLREGAEQAAAAKELDSLAARSEASVANAAQRMSTNFRTKLVAPRELVGFRDSLLMLAGAVALVLLIACANVAHLMLARAATRQRELAVRAALGAGRARLLRQLLTESLVLAAAGCVGGIAIGWLALQAIIAVRPPSLGELGAVRMEPIALGVAAAISVVTGVLFGMVGAVQSARHGTHDALKAGALSASGTRRQQRLRSALVVSEIALSTCLLVGATLLVRSVMHLQSIDLGFDSRNLYGVEVALPQGADGRPVGHVAFYDQLLERARAIPGVRAVTLAGGAPPRRSFMVGALHVEGKPAPPAGSSSFIPFNPVSDDFFRFMGIRLLEGTMFTDTSSKARQVIVNEGMAKKQWPGESAVGKRLRVSFGNEGDWMTVVGVVADARTGGVTSDPADAMIYTPVGHAFSLAALVRTSGGGDPIGQLRAVAASIDANLPPPTITSVEDAVTQGIARPRFTMLLLAAFSTLALVLSAVGLYGVMAYAVAQRTREIGIRIALGATRRTIARAVLGQGAALAVAGVVSGLLAAAWGTKLLQKMLYGVERTDPASFMAGAAVLLATALVACVVPMRRAVRVDPQVAMRAE